MTQTRTALVIGGGIAGPVAAMALQKAGIDVTVYEAYDSMADGIGGGLSIAPNGLNALGVIGADDAVRRIGTPMTALVMQSWTGKVLAELGTPPGQPDQQFVWRPELYRALYDEAAGRGIRIEHGKRLIDLTDTGAEVTARFADGTRAGADILIGADGIRSTVRSLIDPAAPQPRYAGLFNIGGRIAASGLPSTGGKMYMSFGKRAFFGYQVLDDGEAGWFVNLPMREPMSLGEARARSTQHWLAALGEAFAGDRTPALDLIRRTDPADLLVIGAMEDLPTVPTWRKGRVVLVGDAAHATSPSSGQGASLAIESGIQLARCVRDLPYEPAFAAYEQLRRDRCEKIIAMAARTNSNKAAGPLARILRDLFLPVAMRMLARSGTLTWQYDYRIKWDAPVASVPATV
jgi:FAD-dependent urate hydroxylase